MKKIIFSTIVIITFTLLISGAVFAQGDGHTAHKEAEGKIVWEKLQAKQVQCSDLSDDEFGVLGEYFMGQMTGASHETMNTMMEQMMGKEGEEQMHVVMGKRLSGCDASAAIPSQGVGFMPMMQMMMGGANNSMMNFGFASFGWFGWIFMILWWVLIIAGIVALIKWLTNQFRRTHGRGAGFTLVELLVVIAIIGLLSSVVLVSMQGTRAKARDATRKEALRNVQLALELYYDKYEAYPSTGGALWAEGRCVDPPPSWGWVIKPDYSGANTYIPNLTPQFMGSLPGDPAVNGINGRCYGYWGDGTKYSIWAHFGAESSYSINDPMVRILPESGCTVAQNTFFKAQGFAQCF